VVAHTVMPNILCLARSREL